MVDETVSTNLQNSEADPCHCGRHVRSPDRTRFGFYSWAGNCRRSTRTRHPEYRICVGEELAKEDACKDQFKKRGKSRKT